MPRPPARLRVALLSYRGNPHSGGQGVYVRHLSLGLAEAGVDVEVIAGPPYPDIDHVPGTDPAATKGADPSPRLTRVRSLDLYREPDPFRRPALREFGSAVDVLEYGLMCTAGFPEPLTFSMRVAQLLAARRRRGEQLPHVVHDNQGLGYGLLALRRTGLPVVATVHHPITVDRDLALAAVRGWRRRLGLRRWYGFARMQGRVLRRLDGVVAPSAVAARGVESAFGLDPQTVSVVPIGVDHEVFSPQPGIPRVRGRLISVVSADMPLKGLDVLLEALAKLRVERQADLVVVGRPGDETRRAIDRLGLDGAVRFAPAVSTGELVRLFAEAEVAVVPSLYEGFSLPAIEAMACGVALVATTGGALPEVVGRDGAAGLLVAPGDPGTLAAGIRTLLDDPARRARMGRAGRERVRRLFTWRATADRMVEHYRRVLAARRTRPG